MLERAWLTGVASKRVSEEWGVLEGYRNIGYMECGGHGGGLRGGGAEVSFGCLINYWAIVDSTAAAAAAIVEAPSFLPNVPASRDDISDTLVRRGEGGGKKKER